MSGGSGASCFGETFKTVRVANGKGFISANKTLTSLLIDVITGVPAGDISP